LASRVLDDLENFNDSLVDKRTWEEKLKGKWDDFAKKFTLKNMWENVKTGSVLGFKALGMLEVYFKPEKSTWDPSLPGESDVVGKVWKRVGGDMKNYLEAKDKIKGIISNHENTLKWIKLKYEELILRARVGPPSGFDAKAEKEWYSKINKDIKEWKTVRRNEQIGWEKWIKGGKKPSGNGFLRKTTAVEISDLKADVSDLKAKFNID
jgi:hypothetical protein